LRRRQKRKAGDRQRDEKKTRRKGDRPIDFLKRRVVTFLVFIFVEVGLLNCINCSLHYPFPRIGGPSLRKCLEKISYGESCGVWVSLFFALTAIQFRVETGEPSSRCALEKRPHFG
jgi:hypothetical protein